jgi:hypothetical protein
VRENFLRSLAILALAAIAIPVDARPRVIEESQRLAAPDPTYGYFAQSVAIDGDWALATALQSDDGSFNYPYRQLALLYRRAASGWVFDRVLVADPTEELSWNDPKVAMKNGLASVSTAPLRAFRRNGANWVAMPNPFPAAPRDPAWANGLTRIDGETVAAIAGRCNYGAVSSDLVAGSWTAPRAVTGNARICTLPNYSGSMDIDGNRLVVTNPQEDREQPPTQARIYQRTGPGAPWLLADTLSAGEYGFGVALEGNDLFIGSWHPLGTEIRRLVDGEWQPAGHLPTLSGYDAYYTGANHITRGDGFILASTSRHDDVPAGIAVYQRNGAGNYLHVAQLQASNGDTLGPVAEISGRTVVVSGLGVDSAQEGRLYFFELPERLSSNRVLQDDFENGATRWVIENGQFTITRRSFTNAFYQSYLGNGSAAVLSGSEADNQSVQAVVRPRGFSGADRWVGLSSRYHDWSNYYHVALRNSDRVQLRRVLNGESQVLATAPFDVSVNRNYRLRLESIGSRHRVFIDDVLVLEARDDAVMRGHAALLSYRAAADFDDVVVTPNARTLMYDNSLDGAYCRQFVGEFGLRESGAPEWDCNDYDAGYLRQASSSDVARAAIGPSTDDQVVESRLTPESFADGSSQDKWIAVLARYRDENDYYYLTLRSSNTVSLRKLVNGQISELDTANFTVEPGAWHTLRLEAVGDRLRGYVDDALLVEAVDDAHATGSGGIATLRTVGRFDYLRVIQP